MLEAFLATLKSESTKRNYKKNVSDFMKHFDGVDLEIVSIKLVIQYISTLDTVSKRNVASSAISSYLKFIKHKDVGDDGRIKELSKYVHKQKTDLSSSEKKINNKGFLDANAIMRLVNNVKNRLVRDKQNPDDFKFCYIIQLYLNAVSLRTDIFHLKREQYDQETGVIRIGKCIKTKKEIGEIKLSELDKKTLDEYLQLESRNCDGHLFYCGGASTNIGDNLRKRLAEWSNKNLGVRLNMNYLRKCVINSHEQTIKGLPATERVKSREILAKRMGHNVETQQKSYVVDKFQSSIPNTVNEEPIDSGLVMKFGRLQVVIKRV